MGKNTFVVRCSTLISKNRISYPSMSVVHLQLHAVFDKIVLQKFEASILLNNPFFNLVPNECSPLRTSRSFQQSKKSRRSFN